ncbi:MAG: hypothetical protein QXR30_01650 [Candidatus Woesearchaeota archaeon]
MKIYQEKRFLYLLLISLLITFLDIFLKRIYLKKGLAIINPDLMYGLKFYFFDLNFLIYSLFLFFFILSIVGFIKNNDFKFFIFPTIVSLSNVIDRIQFNGVIDYIKIPIFPYDYFFGYFNLCDATIVIFIIFLFFYEILKK